MELSYFVILIILLFVGLFSVGFALVLAMAAKRGDGLRAQHFDCLPAERDLGVNSGLAKLRASIEKLEELDQLAHFMAVERQAGEKGIAASA